MTVLPKIKSHSDEVDYYKKLPFYSKHIQKPKVKRLKNIDWLLGFSLYEKLDVIKTDQAFSGYAMSNKVQIVERIDPIVQLKVSNLSIKFFLVIS